MNINKPFREDWRLSQSFGANPSSYAKFGLKGHNGLDFACPTGTTITACDDGTIGTIADDPTGYGHYIKVIHSWGESIYAHLQNHLVTVGFPVKKGQAIGISNNTGNSTGPHLHFGIRINPYNTKDGWSGYSDPTPYFGATNPSTPPGGGANMLLISDVIKACWRAITGSEASDFDVKNEESKTPFILEDLIKRLINASNYHSDSDFKNLELQLKEANDKIRILQEKIDQGLENPTPQPTPGDGGTGTGTTPPLDDGNTGNSDSTGFFEAVYLFIRKFFTGK